MAPRDPALQYLIDRAEIEDLLDRYAISVDRRDFDAVAGCFAENVGGQWGPGVIGNREELIEYISGVARFDSTMHMMGNRRVEVTSTGLDGDPARLSALAMLRHFAMRRDGSEFRYDPSGGRYSERLERRDGRWLVIERGASPPEPNDKGSELGSDDPALQWLLDRAAIEDAIVSYAGAIDARDWAALRDSLSAGFVAGWGWASTAEVDPHIDGLRADIDRFESTTHFVGRPAIVVQAARQAIAVTPVIVTRREGGDAPEQLSCTHWRHGLWRPQGPWRIFREQSELLPLPDTDVPQSGDPEVRALLDRAAVGDRIARHSHAEDYAESGGTLRLSGNRLLEVDGDRASAESYAYVSHQDGEGGWTHWAEGAMRYLDTLVRRDGGWRIEERHTEDAYTHVPVR